MIVICGTQVEANHISRPFFQKFDFSVQGQKMVQNEERFCLLYSISQEPYIIWLSFMVDKCKMIIFPVVFFLHFFKILVFWFVSGIKRQKMTQNDKYFFLLCLTSQESLFILHMRKRKHLLICFQFLIFGANSGAKGQKMTQNDRKLCIAPTSHEAYTIWLWFLVHIYKRMASSYAVFTFLIFWFSGLLWG